MTSSKKKILQIFSLFTMTHKSKTQKFIMANSLIIVSSIAGDCWEESVGRISTLCAKHSVLLYHLSLVHALRGDAQNSLRSYNDFRS